LVYKEEDYDNSSAADHFNGKQVGTLKADLLDQLQTLTV
jgi:hypothetical protein